jgi:hypothetical protein
MLYLPEFIIGTFILLILLLLALNYSPKSKEKKLGLLKKYRRTQHLSFKLQDTLSNYILRNDALDREFKDGKNFGDYLNYLKTNHQKNLSEKKYLKVRNGFNPLYFKVTSIHLDKQKEKLKQLKEPIMELV